jgi:sulfite exporter TauE/SafE
MMPPQGHLIKISLKGAEGMTKESEAWAEALEPFVESHLKADGVAINSATNPFSTGASDDEIRRVISQVEEKLDNLSPLMMKKPREISKSAYTLGDQVGMLPCSENSDILVFVQGDGQVLTGGRATMTFVAGGPAEGALLRITMADAKTGEIVGFIRIYTGFGFLSGAEDTFGERLDEHLGIMNFGSARKKVKPH